MEQKAALITGGSRGIGRGIALALAKAGCSLVINFARDEDAARRTALECEQQATASGFQIKAHICRADISLSDDRKRLVDFARQRFPRLDCLVNNAGVAPSVRSDLLDATEESFDRVLETNLKGPYFLTQLVARWMIEQGPLVDRRPIIVIIGSISAYTASVNRGEYCIAKAGIAMLATLYAVRLAEYNIGVFEVRPGIIQTDMTAGVKQKYDQLIQDGLTPIARWGQPDDIGKAVSALLSGAFPFSTGQVLDVDGGFHLRRL